MRWGDDQGRLRVLHVDDDDTDAQLLMEALDDASQHWRQVATMFRVRSAEEAISMLEDPDVRLPHLILLDLSLPGRSGHDLLNVIKSSTPPHRAKRVPVVVVSTSQASIDVERAYDGFAAGYATKPSSYLDLIQLMEALSAFWLRHATLPK